jgi:hypothetical protein
VSARARRVVVTTSYAVLGSILCWSRLARLGGGYCCDEIATVSNYVRAGPVTILTGSYAPNNHELFSLLGWATSSVVGESEIALRLGAAIPFIVGAVVVTAWLHVRTSALAAILFLAFATASPLLIDISRQARGYGIAFLAMSVMIVAALEADRSGRTWAVAAFWAAGLVGTWTLPHFAIAFAATGAVLLTQRSLRIRCLVGATSSTVAVAVWYAPHFDDLAASSLQEYGSPIAARWLLTAPSDQILVPSLSLDETVVHPTLAWLIPAAAFAILVGSSPLLRRRYPALILTSGVVTTVLVFWITGTHVVPRFLSFLLVPLFVLLATGCASILERLTSKPALVRTAIVLATLGVFAFTSVPVLTKVTRMPRDSLRETAAVIRENAPPVAPVYAYMPYSADLAFHLHRIVTHVTTAAEAMAVCRARGPAVYVAQPWFLPPAPIPSCVSRGGTRHFRFEQYARGGETDAWVIPARP